MIKFGTVVESGSHAIVYCTKYSRTVCLR